MEKPTALTKYFETKLAVIEVKEGETEEEAWRRYLATHPGYANTHIKIFQYPAKACPSKAKGHSEILQLRRKHGKNPG
jgi:hypothetical protein